MKKKAGRIKELLKELFSELPEWGKYAVMITLVIMVIIFWVIIWELIGPFTIEWILNPLTYVFLIILGFGATLFSAYWFVIVTIGALLEIPKRFREVKIKEIPGIFGYLFLYIIWILLTLLFFGATVNLLLEPFDISLQSLGILPHIYSGYFLDHPVYIFGYKIIPIFD